MKMDKTDEHIRDNLENIMNGEWDKHFNEEQLEIAKKNLIFVKSYNRD